MDSLIQFIPLVIFGFILGVPFYFVAKKKGYGGPKTIFFCFCPLVNWFTGMMYVGFPDLILRDLVRLSIERKEVKRCPFCAETVISEAVVCKHCGRDIPKDKS